MPMRTGVRASQATHQNMLNGSPSTLGYTRSQRGTEKHIPQKGTNEMSIDAVDGLLITRGPEDSRGSPGHEQIRPRYLSARRTAFSAMGSMTA